MTVEEPYVARMTKIHLDESLQNLQHGWQRTPTGLPVGYHISNTDVNPLEYDVSYEEFRRTTLIQFDDGHWGLIETREKMEMIFIDLTFDPPGMRGVITILSDDAAAPEEMGFTLGGDLSIQPRAQRGEQEQEEEKYPKEIPMAPEDEGDDGGAAGRWRERGRQGCCRVFHGGQDRRQRHRVQFNVFFDFTSSCLHIPRDLNFWFRAEMLQEVGEPHEDFGATRSVWGSANTQENSDKGSTFFSDPSWKAQWLSGSETLPHSFALCDGAHIVWHIADVPIDMNEMMLPKKG